MRRVIIASPLLVVLAVACTTAQSYKQQTEDFINDESAVESEVGGDVTEAECEEPASTDVGTTYKCTANVAEIGEMTFDVLINKEDSFLVTSIAPS